MISVAILAMKILAKQTAVLVPGSSRMGCRQCLSFESSLSISRRYLVGIGGLFL